MTCCECYGDGGQGQTQCPACGRTGTEREDMAGLEIFDPWAVDQGPGPAVAVFVPAPRPRGRTVSATAYLALPNLTKAEYLAIIRQTWVRTTAPAPKPCPETINRRNRT